MSFDVYIDGTTEGTPAAAERLADHIAASFGVDQATVMQYLARGRFRVRGGLDEATARGLARQLEQLGARVTVAAAGAPPPAPGARPPGAPPATVIGRPVPPAPTPPPPAASASQAMAANSARNIAAPVVSGGQRYESGLAAAFAAPTAHASLGALDAGAISLSSIDGSNEEREPEPTVVGAPRGAVADDAFLAPDQREEEPTLDIEPSAPRPPPASPFVGETAAPPPPASPLAPLSGGLSHAAASSRSLARPQPPAHGVTAVGSDGLLANALDLFRSSARVRWAVGVVLAVALGFLPVVIYGGAAEEGKYAEIRTEVMQAFAAVQTKAQWDALEAPDGAIASAQVAQLRARGRLRMTGALIWLVTAGVAAFAWRKKFVEEE